MNEELEDARNKTPKLCLEISLKSEYLQGKDKVAITIRFIVISLI